MRLLLGTSKGLVVWQKKSAQWRVVATHFVGFPVSMIFVNPYDAAWWVGVSHRHWGQKLHRSDDGGLSWQEVPVPRFPADAEYRRGQLAKLRKIWCMAAAKTEHSTRLWLGVEPAALFWSEDEGQSWHLENNLWDHPSRMDPNQWFGAGRDQPFLHSIVVLPNDSQHLYVGISCAGVFESQNGGQSWTARNQGLIAAYLPKSDVEIGHDPHRILACRSQPEVMWQQNHCGVFRSTDGGKHWQLVNDPGEQVDYGFALAIDHADPARAWVIPVRSDLERVAPELALGVAYTADGGQSWETLREGLPQHHCFDIVLRHSFDRSEEVLAFGTNHGNLFLSEDEGRHWQHLAATLPRVEALRLLP